VLVMTIALRTGIVAQVWAWRGGKTWAAGRRRGELGMAAATAAAKIWRIDISNLRRYRRVFDLIAQTSLSMARHLSLAVAVCASFNVCGVAAHVIRAACSGGSSASEGRATCAEAAKTR